MSLDCCVALPHGAMALSAVCDCGFSLSYSLTIFGRNDPIWSSLIIVQMVPVHCISRSLRLKIDFQDEDY